VKSHRSQVSGTRRGTVPPKKANIAAWARNHDSCRLSRHASTNAYRLNGRHATNRDTVRELFCGGASDGRSRHHTLGAATSALPRPAQAPGEPGPNPVAQTRSRVPRGRKQRRIHLALWHLHNVVSTKACPIRSIEHRLNAVPGHALSGRDRPARQSLIAQLQDKLRLDLPYHYQ
jgi:hypothetical protein